MRNVTPHPLNLLGIAIAVLCLLAGGWLLYSDWHTLLQFLKLFLGFFLLILGLGILGANLRMK
jgi:hypothetical protein